MFGTSKFQQHFNEEYCPSNSLNLTLDNVEEEVRV